MAEAITALLGKYRYQQPRLFQTARSAEEPTHLAGGSSYGNDWNGPHYDRVGSCGGTPPASWSWDNPGGDWLDATQIVQGATPWFSVVSNASSGVHEHSVDCTAALQFVQTQDRWAAFIIRCDSRAIASPFSTTYPAPIVNVTYEGGSQAVLSCTIVSRIDNSTFQPLSAAPDTTLPAFIEFDRPTAAVASATMVFTVTQNWASSNATVKFFVLDPPINTDPVVTGIAWGAPMDAGLVGHPDIINFPHRYEDGSVSSDFIASGPPTSSGSSYDPYILQGTVGPADTSGATYPSKGLGKFINSGNRDGNDLVSSSYTGEGFQPLAPGLGAMRLHLNDHISQDLANPVIYEGYGPEHYSGSGVGGRIFMPEPLFGLLDHIFVRYYMRIGTPNGTPYRMPIAKRYQIRQDSTTSPLVWTDCSGKTGITAGHVCEGVNSGGSGGGYGWQMRHRWADCTSDETGPDVGGWGVGVHTFDFLGRNPVGYRYGGANQFNDSFGARGGLGSILYADQWYCIETETKLNTVMTDAPGFLADGWVKVFVDGRLAMEKQNLVVRSLPLMYDVAGVPTPNPPYRDGFVQPCRELGINLLWLDWFHGGLTANTIPRTQFIAGLAYGHSYIGPMRMS